MRRVLKRRPLSESAVVKSEARWSKDNNVIGRPLWNLILTDDECSKRQGMAMLDERYEGSLDWRTLYVSVATLESILHLIAASAGCEVSLRCWIGHVDELLLEQVFSGFALACVEPRSKHW